MSPPSESFVEARAGRWLTAAESTLYGAIAILLLAAAVALLGATAWTFLGSLRHEPIGPAALLMLNDLLLVLMMIELFHTVRVSIREHTLVAEPFLIVGLIAGVRRVLIITAEAWHLGETDPEQFTRAMMELGLLTLMTLAIVVSIILLRRNEGTQSSW